MTKILLILAAIVLAQAVVMAHDHDFPCVHDEMFKDYVVPGTNEFDHQNDHERMLGMDLLEATPQPLRVHLDFSSVEQSKLDYPDYKKKLEFLERDLVPVAKKVFEQRLKTYRRKSGKITIPSWMSKCYQAKTIPGKEYDADLVVMVSAKPENQGFTAWATPCLNDNSANGRPIMGQYNVNLKYFSDQGKDFEANLGTCIHEIVHILGFSRNAFPNFVNPKTGAKIGQGNIIEDATFRGFETKIIKTPTVLKVAREHYGISNNDERFKGVEVENQGGSGSLGSHWERTILMNELMTASRIKHRSFSKFSLAVLQDSGWYETAPEYSDEFFFGRDEGYDFIEKACKADSKPREFCYGGEKTVCSIDYNARGYCRAESFSDNCQYKQAYSNGDCTKSGGNDDVKCVEYEGGASCFDYSCNSAHTSATIKQGSSQVTCTQQGETKDLGGRKISCPDPKKFCETYYEHCPNFCSSRGKCIRGQCFCAPGWVGEDCSKESACKDDCNSHGQCQEDGSCQCDQGWTGDGCTVCSGDACNKCPNDCSGNGQCNKGVCTCNTGWEMNDCSQKAALKCPKDCSENGECNGETGKCTCDNGWEGEDCSKQQVKQCPSNCNGNGVCHTQSGKCSCNSGWKGNACSEKVQTDSNCKNLKADSTCESWKGKGYCEGKYANYLKQNCAATCGHCTGAGCGNDCNGKGQCKYGSCKCYVGWSGSDCQTQGQKCIEKNSLTEKCAKCLDNSQCSEGKFCCPFMKKCVASSSESCTQPIADCRPTCRTAECTSCKNWSDNKGSNWQLPTCTGDNGGDNGNTEKKCPNNCSGNGSCNTQTGKCSCKSTHSGNDCSQKVPKKCPNSCSGNGSCDTNTGKCSCKAGFSGSDCKTSTTSGGDSDCKNKRAGTACDSWAKAGYCTKSYVAYMEANCAKSCGKCGGSDNGGSTEKQCPNNCSGKGTCDKTTGKCKCNSGWQGSSCQTKTPKQCPNSCSSNGSCNTNTGECSCNSGFSGNDCSTKNVSTGGSGSGSSSCKNQQRDTLCEQWKVKYCNDATYKSYMTKYCAKTCGAC